VHWRLLLTSGLTILLTLQLSSPVDRETCSYIRSVGLDYKDHAEVSGVEARRITLVTFHAEICTNLLEYHVPMYMRLFIRIKGFVLEGDLDYGLDEDRTCRIRFLL
jgi:hypothetical protein